MRIKKYLILAVIALGASFVARSQAVSGISVEGPQLLRSEDGNRMTVSMDLRLGELELGRNRTAVFVPVLVNGSDSRALKPVSVYGRNRWYRAQRAGADMTDALRYKDRPSLLSYSETVPYEDWMDGARLELRRQDYGCCDSPAGESAAVIGGYAAAPSPAPYVPEFRYVRPQAQAVKTSSLSGRAFIDFRSGQSEIDPTYGRNAAELSKITSTIDSVRNDADITVTSIRIKGSASPEGKYASNERLAKGRTESLKNYVQRQYAFAGGLVKTEYVAEDWEGLREYVSGSSLPSKSELLEIIDDASLDPDTKDWRMKLRYPEEYKVLLEEAYPSLRYSDYRIEYTVRSYGDAAEIAEIFRTNPVKLSLEELFVLSQTLEAGSDAYAEVYETAVRLYPGDETANLNAANAAMQRGDLEKAARYLEKAGESAEAVYARSVLDRLRAEASNKR